MHKDLGVSELEPLSVHIQSYQFALSMANQYRSKLKTAELEEKASLELKVLDWLKMANDWAAKASPFRHRRLAGDKPLEDDKAAGPASVFLIEGEAGI